MKKIVIKIGIALAAAITLVFVVPMLTGCKSFKPIIVEGQPDECNDFYSVLSFYTKQDKGDAAFVGIVYSECKEARGQKREIEKELNCRTIGFQKDPIDKSKYEKYTGYMECMSKK